jgi:hypothetical protein
LGKNKGKEPKGSKDRNRFYCQKKGNVKVDFKKIIQDKKKSGDTGQHELPIEIDWQQAPGGEAEDIAWISALGQDSDEDYVGAYCDWHELDGIEHEPVMIMVDGSASASTCLRYAHQSRRPERS